MVKVLYNSSKRVDGMKCLFMYNPNSGKGRIVKHLKYIESKLKEKYDIVHMYQTTSSEDTIRAANDACGVYDALVFSGGDGTFNDVITGVSSNNSRPILGYLPSGTVNDIARNLKISRNIKRALDNVIHGDIFNHDVGKINDRYFMYVVAAGTFTEVSYRTEQRIKRKLGKLAYVVDGMKDILNPIFTNVMIEADGIEVSDMASLVLILNSKSVGGIPFNKHGHLNDGLFDIVMVKKGFFKGVFNIFKLFTFGVSRRRKRKYLVSLRATNIKVYVSDDVVWTLDGEKGPSGNIEIQNLHKHLQIFVPKRNQRKKKKMEEIYE